MGAHAVDGNGDAGTAVHAVALPSAHGGVAQESLSGSSTWTRQGVRSGSNWSSMSTD